MIIRFKNSRHTYNQLVNSFLPSKKLISVLFLFPKRVVIISEKILFVQYNSKSENNQTIILKYFLKNIPFLIKGD